MNLEKVLKNNKIYNLLKSSEGDIYLVGGAVRDVILYGDRKEIHDCDIIVTDIPAKKWVENFADNNDVAAVVPLDVENNIYRIVLADKINYIDVTNPISNSLEEDIRRRDLTINAIAFNIKSGEIIDLTGGVDDLNNKIIRAVSEENFKDDPLRIIRAYRFASVLGFKIDSDTVKIINRHKSTVLYPAVERRNCEILKLFGGKFAHDVIKMMDSVELIDILFPIMIDVKKIPPNTHHHLDLFNHSVETVKQIQFLYENSRKEVREHLDRVDFGGDTRLAHLKFAGFLHDIGKFSCWTIEDNGRHRFIGHDEIGEHLAQGILKESKFSKKQIEYIKFIIRHHIYPSAVVSAQNINEKIYMRYIRKTGDNAIDLITIAKADRLSALGKAITEDVVKSNIYALDKLQDFYIHIKPALKPVPKLLDGNEIMDIKNIKPSEYLGEIIDSLHKAQLDGDVLTKEEAIEFVKKYE